MTGAEIGILVPAIVAFLGAAAAYLKAHTVNRKLDNHLNNVIVKYQTK